MFIKFMGSLFAIFGSALIGYYFSKKASYRMNELNEMKRALNMLRSEIEYSVTELPEAAENIAAKSSGISSAFFLKMRDHMCSEGETAYTAWNKAAADTLPRSYLSPEDIENVSSLGQTLGYIDRRLQLSSISMVTDYIDVKRAELAEICAKDKKLYTSLGIMAGIAITIVLY